MPKPNPNLLAANTAAGYPPPILYLPLSDPTQPGKNLGTGGDFALNGVVARSGRGPSQFNAPYSDLDGVADYLSRTTAPAGIADGKAFTLHFAMNPDASTGQVITFASSTTNRFLCYFNSARKIEVQAANSDGSTIFAVESSVVCALGRNYVVEVSVDLSNSANRALVINGVIDSSATWPVYTNADIDFSIANTPSRYYIGATATPSSYFNGRLGNVFFDTRYIDLSAPANLAKFITGTGIDAKPVDLGANGELPFGTPPLIYLPMYGNNAGKNYGTGGDFTVNSGPYTGARGPNEFWGNWADFGAAAGALVRTTGLVGVSDGKTLSASLFFYMSSQQAEYFSLSSSGNPKIVFGHDSSIFKLYFYNSAGAVVCQFAGANITTGAAHSLQICVDLSDATKRFVYLDGIAMAGTWNTYSNANANIGAPIVSLGNSYQYSALQGKRAEFYFATEYIDFSQEANRLKFRDAFGNPVDLRPQIAAGTLPNPAIYMRFDPANFGKNDGTGGDFVVNGTITDGGQL